MSLVKSENLVLLDSLACQAPKETWEDRDLKAVLVYRVLEETLVNQEMLVSLEKWDLLEKTGSMEKREALDLLVPLDPQDFLVQEANLVLMEVLDLQESRV